MKRQVAAWAVLMLLASTVVGQEDGYTLTHVAKGMLFNLGPTGIWANGTSARSKHGPGLLNLLAVDRAEVGSPASGVVEANDVITGVNGKPFEAGVDPRFAFAFAIEDSEAKDGKLHIDILRGGAPMTVTLKLNRIPAYSATWPFDCERTDTMLRNACEYLRQEQMPQGDIVADDGNIGPTQAGLLWLATGEPRYLQNAICAAYWYKEQCEAGKAGWTWTMGYGGLLMAEYYNMTGDKNILPGLENIARIIAKGQMPSGGWSHGPYNGFGAGYGEVNCSGMISFMALLEARECGVKVDEEAIRKAERYFDKFAPAISNAYGDHAFKYDKLHYDGMNGKIGGMAVNWRLDGKPEYSALHALKAARSAYGIEGGHTGHFFNVMWTSIAASEAPAKEYRGLMDQLGWYFTLSRHWRGGLFCQPGPGGSKYSTEGGVNMTTGGYGLVLATPRHHLRILGAPKSVFVQTLPAALEEAKKLHQSRQWDAAIKAVDAFLKDVKPDPETLRLAHELRDKSRYMKEGVAEAYSKLEELASGSERPPKLGSRPYKASGIIKHLRMLLGEDDARLKQIESTFPEKYQPIWTHDEEFPQAFRTLRSLHTMSWFIFKTLLDETIPDFAMPPDYPAWTRIAEVPAEGGTWKVAVISPDQKEPAGWAETGFDDTSWKGPEKVDVGQGKKVKKEKVPEGSTYLVRVPFELENPNVKQLRICTLSRLAGLAVGGKVYLNGVCVMETETGFLNGKNVNRLTLLPNTRDLLKKGRNVLAFSSKAGGKGGDMPHLALDADAIKSKPFHWTVDPSRDVEIRKLVTQRRVPEPYYQAEKDQRTPQELMTAFTAEPFFMPEAACALGRFEQLLPNVNDRTPYVETLLKSSNWGARWCGVILVKSAMTFPDWKSDGGGKADNAEGNASLAAGRVWAKQFLPQILSMLREPHPMVRQEAANTAGLIGAEAKAGIPDLIKLVEDVDGQNWYIRKAAFEALEKMPVDEMTKQAFMRVALKDPGSTMRSTVLGATLNARDPGVRKAATQTYEKEMVDQVFDAPHGMFTKGTRREMALRLLECLTKDEIRPMLPRFFESLKQPTGTQLEGSIAVIISFGDEVRPKLEELAQADDLITRYNAVDALLQMAAGKKPAPEKVEFLIRQVEPLLKIDDPKKADTATKWLEMLKTGNWAPVGPTSEPAPESTGGDNDQSNEANQDTKE